MTPPLSPDEGARRQAERNRVAWKREARKRMERQWQAWQHARAGSSWVAQAIGVQPMAVDDDDDDVVARWNVAFQDLPGDVVLFFDVLFPATAALAAPRFADATGWAPAAEDLAVASDTLELVQCHTSAQWSPTVSAANMLIGMYADVSTRMSKPMSTPMTERTATAPQAV
jgi:hypothetical protein